MTPIAELVLGPFIVPLAACIILLAGRIIVAVVESYRDFQSHKGN